MNSLMDTSSRVALVQDSVLDQRGLQSIKRMNNNDQTPEAMREVAKKFEGMLLSQMLKTMRETNEVFAEGNPFGSNEEKFHRDMMDEQMVLNLTSGRGIGIADHFYQQMMARYESTQAKSANTDGNLGHVPLPMPLNKSGDARVINGKFVASSASASLGIGTLHGARQLEMVRDVAPTASNPESNSHILKSADSASPLDALQAELDQLLQGQTSRSRLAQSADARAAEAADNQHLGDFFNARDKSGASPFAPVRPSRALAFGIDTDAAMRAASFNGISAAGADTQAAQRNFVEKIRPHAERAARELNVDANVLIAQAALETGWGKHELRAADGSKSFNLFNIKATNAWQGPRVAVQTLEYRGNQGSYEQAEFRRYGDYAESFSDYVRLIGSNDRYSKARAVSENPEQYADALQAAGYATDPNYAKKIKQLLKHELLSAAPNLASIAAGIIPGRSNRTGLME